MKAIVLERNVLYNFVKLFLKNEGHLLLAVRQFIRKAITVNDCILRKPIKTKILGLASIIHVGKARNLTFTEPNNY